MFGARSFFAWKLVQDVEERRNSAQQRSLCPTSYSEKKFLQIYRLSKTAFHYLCALLKDDTNLKSSQRVSLETKVLTALLFYAHGDYQKVIGVANNFSQIAVSRYVSEVTEALNHPNVVNKFIKFPCTPEARQLAKQNFYNKYGFPEVVGCVDCTHIRIVQPKRSEEHLYFCRKHYHSLNVQMISDHQGRIIAVNPKFGGATHDAFIWDNSCINSIMQTCHRNGECIWLLGDSGYPQRPWLMSPYHNPIPGSAEQTYNNLHVKTRVIIENTFGRLKNRWRCLHKDRALHYKPQKCANIIIACSVLHNISLDFQVSTDEYEMLENPSNDVMMNEDNSDEQSLLLLGRQLRDRLAIRLHTANQPT